MLDQVIEAGERAGREFHAKALQQRDSGGTSPERAAELAVFLASAEAQENHRAIDQRRLGRLESPAAARGRNPGVFAVHAAPD